VRFFKEIGLIKQFMLYQTTSNRNYEKISPFVSDPIFAFGRTAITNWIDTSLGKELFIDGTTLYYPFISFVETFYPKFMSTQGLTEHYKIKYKTNPPWHINKESRTIKLYTIEEQKERLEKIKYNYIP
jgi:hypothetical protein